MAKTDPWGIVAATAGTLLAVGLVVLIMVVLEAHPAGATFPGKPGKIAYDAYDAPTNGDREIYTINSVGGGRVQLTDNSTDDEIPSYSPSGKKIVYSGLDAPTGDYEIYTINAGGGGRFQVTDNSTDDYEPFWGSK